AWPGWPSLAPTVGPGGTVPSTSWAEPLSPAWGAGLETNPKPPARGNSSPATSTAASTQLPASLASVCVIGTFDTVPRVRGAADGAAGVLEPLGRVRFHNGESACSTCVFGVSFRRVATINRPTGLKYPIACTGVPKDHATVLRSGHTFT